MKKLLAWEFWNQWTARWQSRARRPRQLYEALTVSDQALMREFYLERIEKVNVKVREKYQKIYRYY